MYRPKFLKVLSLALCISLVGLTLTTFVSAQEEATSTEITEETLPTSIWYNLTKVGEFVRLNLLTFNDDSKVELLEEFTDQRIDEMAYAESIEDYEAIDLALERYEDQKVKCVDYIETSEDEELLDEFKTNTLKQQKLMTDIQLNLSNAGETQNNMVQVQTKVATQTQNMIQARQTVEASNEYHNQTKSTWANPNLEKGEESEEWPDNMSDWEYKPGNSGRNSDGTVTEYSESIETNGNGSNSSDSNGNSSSDTSEDSSELQNYDQSNGNGSSSDNGNAGNETDNSSNGNSDSGSSNTSNGNGNN